MLCYSQWKTTTKPHTHTYIIGIGYSALRTKDTHSHGNNRNNDNNNNNTNFHAKLLFSLDAYKHIWEYFHYIIFFNRFILLRF